MSSQQPSCPHQLKESNITDLQCTPRPYVGRATLSDSPVRYNSGVSIARALAMSHVPLGNKLNSYSPRKALSSEPYREDLDWRTW